MTLPVFNFPFHLREVKYPQSSNVVKLGGNWDYATAPQAPDQREITLTVPALVYYTNSDESLDYTTNPQVNLGCLEQFYQSVRQFGMFTYPDPAYGNITVRFKTPLQIPRGEVGSQGSVKGLTVTFTEVPGVTG